MNMINELIQKLRHYAEEYKNPPYGREICGTKELLIQSADAIEELSVKVAQQNGGWIPVKERLPESEFCEVLCQDKYGEMLIGHIYKADLGGEIGLIAESDECVMYDCIAWQPLPQVYEPKVD